MKNRITALAIVSAALLASTGFAQQDDHKNRNQEPRRNQPSRPAPTNDQRSRPSFNGGTNNRTNFQPSRGSYVPSQPRNEPSNRSYAPPSNFRDYQAPRSSQTRQSYEPPRNDYRPSQSYTPSWTQPQQSPNRSNEREPIQHWSGPESWSPAPQRSHGVDFGQSQVTRPQAPQSTPHRNPVTFRHVAVPPMPQPRPSVGQSWNFGRNRPYMAQNFANDVTTHPLKVRPNAHVFQRPEWGGQWREGYLGWTGMPGFQSFGFSCSFYLFTPFYEPCYVSPWYYYSCLPPYLPADRCDLVPDYRCAWDQGTAYRSGDDYANENLDNAISRLQEAFNNQDYQAIEPLVSSSDEVGVFTDGAYDYSLDSQDFEMMMADTVTNTDTVSFDITGVRWFDGGAIIRARHEVQNPDGSDEVVYQRYRLRMEDGNLVITDFMTSH